MVAEKRAAEAVRLQGVISTCLPRGVLGFWGSVGEQLHRVELQTKPILVLQTPFTPTAFYGVLEQK